MSRLPIAGPMLQGNLGAGVRSGAAGCHAVRYDGFELLRTIRSSHTYPVIMLTARDAQQDKIEGLSLGADDYVVKPFRPLELIARVHAQLRRYTSYGSRAQAAESPTIQLDGLEINRDARSVTVDGAPVRLTPTEYSILLYLVEHRGSVVAVEDLFRAVWNEDFYAPAPTIR